MFPITYKQVFKHVRLAIYQTANNVLIIMDIVSIVFKDLLLMKKQVTAKNL